MSAAQQMPIMPAHPPPPPPPASSHGAAWNPYRAPSSARGRLDLPSSRRNSTRISGDEGEDHFTDVDSGYGDPNEPSPSHQHDTGGRYHPANLASVASIPGATPAGLPARQASYSSSSASSSHGSSSPRQSADVPTFNPLQQASARPFSVSSSIWAGKGALHPSAANNRRRAGQPPVPPLPVPAMPSAASALAAAAASASPTNVGRSSTSTSNSGAGHNGMPHSPHSLSSPLSDDYSPGPRQSFESSSLYSYMDDETRAGHGNSPRSPLDWRSADAQGILPDGTSIPPMPPLPITSSAHKSTVPAISTSEVAAAPIPPSSLPSPPKNRGLRPPPLPGTVRRHVLSYEEAEAQEEEEKAAVLRDEELVGGPAANKRLSAMGPKLKKNSLAPWELGDDDGSSGGVPLSSSTGGSSSGSSFNPFSKRPSTDGRDSSDARRTPHTPAKDVIANGASTLASNLFGRPSRDYGALSNKNEHPGMGGTTVESEYTDSTTTSSGFHTSSGDASSATTAANTSVGSRSRTKSISSAAAAGVLKGLGLGSATGSGLPGGVGPVSNGLPSSGSGILASGPSSLGKKSKLAKALRLGNSVSGASAGGYVGGGPSNAQPEDPRRAVQPAFYAPHQNRGSGSGLSHDEGSGTGSGMGGGVNQMPPLPQAVAPPSRTSTSAPHSPVSYSPRGAASPPLPPIKSQALRQNSTNTTTTTTVDDGLMSPTSLASQSLSSTNAHTTASSVSTGPGQGAGGSSVSGPSSSAGGSGGSAGGLKTLKLQPRSSSTSGQGAAASIPWRHRGSTGDGFGGAGGPLTPHLGNRGDGAGNEEAEAEWRKVATLSPRTTSLAISPGGGGGGGPGANGRTTPNGTRSRIATSPSPTPTRLDSLNSGLQPSDSAQTITDPSQRQTSMLSMGSRAAGLERHASPPPMMPSSQPSLAGASANANAAAGASGALGLMSSSSAGDHSDEHNGTANVPSSVPTTIDSQLSSAQSFPRPGQAEGVPYRLISLEEARANQAREREERNARAAKAKAAASSGSGGGGSGTGAASSGTHSSSSMPRSHSGVNGVHMPSSSSHSHDEHGDSALHGSSSGGKVVKKSKSGVFLRMFNKDRHGDHHAHPLPGGHRSGSGEEGRGGYAHGGGEDDGRGSGRGSAGGHHPMPKFTVSPDLSISGSTAAGAGGGAGLGLGGVGTGGAGGGLSAPALKLRPMSSMLSGFSAELLDPTLTETGLSSAVTATSSSAGATGSGNAMVNGTGTSSRSDSISKSPMLLSPKEAASLSPHSGSRSASVTSFVSANNLAGGEDGLKGMGVVGGASLAASQASLGAPSKVGLAATGGATAVGAGPAQALLVGGEAASASMSRRPSDAGPMVDVSSPSNLSAGVSPIQQQQAAALSPVIVTSPTLNVVSDGSGTGTGTGNVPAWKARALELEAKLEEYAAELTELRNTYYTPAAAAAAAEAAAAAAAAGGGGGSATGAGSDGDGHESGDVSMSPSTGPVSPLVGLSERERERRTITPVGGANPTSAQGTPARDGSQHHQPHPQQDGGAPPTSVPGTIIPPCALCSCSCAEQRRQQALNAAALLKGLSVLDRGRAIKPGLQQSSRFGSYALRS